MAAIETKALTKIYKNGRGIRNVDLTVDEGDMFGFIGPNGAGKSTLIRTLLGYIGKTGGDATLLSESIGLGQHINLKRVGYLPGESIFYKGLSVKEILSFSQELRHCQCSKKAAALAELMEIGLDQKVETLSLGNRKKVSILCALQHEPDLYMLDEPTGGLDPLMQKRFWDYMLEENKKGKTVFVSSHTLSEVQRYCRDTAVIRNGHIIARDRVNALMETSTRKVSLVGQMDVSALKGVSDLAHYNGHMSFFYEGDMPTLLGALAAGQIKDVTITEPNLEEVFGRLYGDNRYEDRV